jgi:two-component system, cell cycle sensor histidine kinase and response regulator CckA
LTPHRLKEYGRDDVLWPKANSGDHPAGLKSQTQVLAISFNGSRFMEAHDYQLIRQLLDDYLRMYSSRDDRLTTHFSEDFSGFTGGGDFLVKDRDEWIAITRQDFAQVKEPIRIELKDLAIQSLADTIAVATSFFTIHLPIEDHILSREVARLVLIFRKESVGWKISHSSISIPYYLVRKGEVYPLKELVDRNQKLEEVIAERTAQLSEANENLQRANEKLASEIAERKQAEADKEKLEAQNRQLQKTESLGRMAGAIAHHFNNQL